MTPPHISERGKADGHEPQNFPPMLVLALSLSAAIEPQLFAI